MRRLVAATLVTAAFVGGVFAPTSSADPAVGVRAAAKSLVGLSAPTNNAPRGAYSLAHGWRLIATAGSPPTNAQWYSDPTQPRINQTIAFTGFASDPDGDIATYAWNWGDGNSTGASANDQATHSYTTAGTYTVRLTVTDATALSTAYENTITIRNNWAPADVYAYPDTTADTYPRVGTSATFDFYGYDPEDHYSGNLAWDVNWGDGTAHGTTTTAGFTQLVHTWTTPGTYIIHYSATDTDGTGGGNPNKTTFGTPLVVTVAANPAPRGRVLERRHLSAGGQSDGHLHRLCAGSRRGQHRELPVGLQRRRRVRGPKLGQSVRGRAKSRTSSPSPARSRSACA